MAVDLDHQLGQRVRARRAELGLTLDELGTRSGISRAMISRVERGESSPTATLLARICSGLGVTLASLFTDDERLAAPLARAADQPQWRDPASGYVRRAVSPPGTGSPVEIVDVSFPPATSITLDNPWAGGAIDQHVWLLEGRLEMTVGDDTHALEVGDCLHMRLDRPITFHNPGRRPARYAVVLTGGERRPR